MLRVRSIGERMRWTRGGRTAPRSNGSLRLGTFEPLWISRRVRIGGGRGQLDSARRRNAVGGCRVALANHRVGRTVRLRLASITHSGCLNIRIATHVRSAWHLSICVSGQREAGLRIRQILRLRESGRCGQGGSPKLAGGGNRDCPLSCVNLRVHGKRLGIRLDERRLPSRPGQRLSLQLLGEALQRRVLRNLGTRLKGRPGEHDR